MRGRIRNDCDAASNHNGIHNQTTTTSSPTNPKRSRMVDVKPAACLCLDSAPIPIPIPLHHDALKNHSRMRTNGSTSSTEEDSGRMTSTGQNAIKAHHIRRCQRRRRYPFATTSTTRRGREERRRIIRKRPALASNGHCSRKTFSIHHRLLSLHLSFILIYILSGPTNICSSKIFLVEGVNLNGGSGNSASPIGHSDGPSAAGEESSSSSTNTASLQGQGDVGNSTATNDDNANIPNSKASTRKQRERRELERKRERERERDKKEKGMNNNNNSNNAINNMARDKIRDRDRDNREKRKKKDYKDFLTWCQATLGIQTSLTIQDFTYLDHMEEWKYQHQHYEDEEYDEYSDEFEVANNNKDKDRHQGRTPKSVTVRGLAATRNIQSGETIIAVPYHALITIHTTIDHDPVLSRILGPEARQRHGWMTLQKATNQITGGDGSPASSSGGGSDGNGVDGNSGDYSHTNANDSSSSSSNIKSNVGPVSSAATSYYEIVLLIVALLYHASLGRLSPLWFYIETLTEAPVDSMPYLWTERMMREEFNGEGQAEVKKIVRGIKKDVREMYNDVMGVLIEEHKDIFGSPQDRGDGDDGDGDDKWMFSYERFEWAFTMVNSRHWHLPLQDLDEALRQLRQIREDPDPAQEHFVHSPADAMDMPANQPTDAFVSLHDEALKREDMDDDNAVPPSPSTFPATGIGAVTKHSFMAPLADMLNFGPPCTRGQYNTETKAFEVVATCPFQKGQEVTFWYSDDCEDVIIANYGFTHPMVPRCPTIEDWKYRSDLWKDYAENLEKTLSEAYEDLYDTLHELKECNNVDGENGDKKKKDKIVKAADDRIGMEDVTQRERFGDNNHGGIRRTKLRSLEEERDEIGL